MLGYGLIRGPKFGLGSLDDQWYEFQGLANSLCRTLRTRTIFERAGLQSVERVVAVDHQEWLEPVNLGGDAPLKCQSTFCQPKGAQLDPESAAWRHRQDRPGYLNGFGVLLAHRCDLGVHSFRR